MFTYYAYLIKSQHRLIISSHEIINDDYERLLKVSNFYEIVVQNELKTFCIGYCMGNTGIDKIINNKEEFY